MYFHGKCDGDNPPEGCPYKEKMKIGGNKYDEED